MTILFHELDSAGYLQLETRGAHSLHLVKVRGRSALLEVPAGWWSIWMPLTGTLQVACAEMTWCLRARDLLIWQEGILRNGAQQPNWFLALAGPPHAWLPYLPRNSDDIPSLLPVRDRCPREVRRLLIQAARLAKRDSTSFALVDHLVASGCSAIVENQGLLQLYLHKCNGRTDKLLRLLRVYHFIENNRDRRLELERLSRMASYSPWHLTRLYREVFGETPAEHTLRTRLKRAMELVSCSTLTVRQITERLGFESQSTFCRYFKRAYGVTTSQARSPLLMTQMHPLLVQNENCETGPSFSPRAAL